MCGIAGIWFRDGRPVEEGPLRGMNAMLAHRGPDGDRVLAEGPVGFGHRRLGILDLSRNGDQPMASGDGRFWVTFNGEIHNYVELRDALVALGRRFRSTGDSEVILGAFEEWGSGCFARFNGMWAIAIWDRRDRELTLCRDRFGIKPLCYSARGARIAFASEPKAILRAFPEEREADMDEVHAFVLGVSPDRGTATFFRNIRSVPPGKYLVFCEGGAVREAGYWDFEPGREEPDARAEEKFRHLLTDSVRLRLRSDVPVAALLSGGLDSSAVTRLAAGMANEPIHCFSLRLREADHDESRFSAMAADDPARFRIHWVEPGPGGMPETMRGITWHHDAPMPMRGRCGMWALYGAVRERAKVALIGEGGDEMLAGYDRFLFPHLLDQWRDRGLARALSPRGLREAVALTGLDPGPWWFTWPSVSFMPLALGAGLEMGFAHRFVHPDFRRGRRPIEWDGVLNAWLRRDVPRPFRSHLNNALWLEFRTAGLPELLHAADAMSMAFSVEARPPFLDHRLVEFCFSLPHDEKIRDGWTKSLLRRSTDGILPEAIRWRRDKKGMPTPNSAWMRRDENLGAFRDLLGEPRTLGRGIFEPRQLAGVCDDFLRGRPGSILPYDRLLWHFVTLEMWFRMFIDAPVAPEGAGIHPVAPKTHAAI